MARSYERSFINFSGGMSPQVAPEFIRENEAYRVVNLVSDQGRLRPRKGFAPFTLSSDLYVYAAVQGRFEYIPGFGGDPEYLTRTVLVAHDSSKSTLRVYVADLESPDPAVDEVSPNVDCASYISSHWQQCSAPEGVNIVFFNGAAFIFGGDRSSSGERMRPLVVTYGGGTSFDLQLLDTWADDESRTIDIYIHGGGEMSPAALQVASYDWIVPAGSTSVGYYVTSDYPISRVYAVSDAGNDGAVERVRISYYDGDGFVAVPTTPDYSGAEITEAPLPAAGHSEYLFWPNPMYLSEDGYWHYGAGSLDSTDRIPTAKYVLYVEVIADSAPAADQFYTLSFFFDPFAYATQNASIERAFSHNQRLWAQGGNVLNQSSYNDASGWHTADVEIFEDGGPSINAWSSFRGTLFVFKDTQTYALSGTSYLNYQKRDLFTIGATHAIATTTGVWFSSGRDLYYSTGSTYIRVNRHVVDESDGEITGLFFFDNLVWVQHEHSCYVFDPDQLDQQVSDPGEGRVSMFEVVGPHTLRSVINERFVLADPDATQNIEQISDSGADYGPNFSTEWTSHYFMNGNPGTATQIERVKIELGAAGEYTFTVSPERGRIAQNAGVESYSTIIPSGTSPAVSGYESSRMGELTLPYQVDGRSVRFSITHDGVGNTADVRLYGIHLAFRRRKF